MSSRLSLAGNVEANSNFTLQEARFPLYLIIPLIVFVIDRLMGIKQTALELEVIESECLPSGKSKLPSFVD